MARWPLFRGVTRAPPPQTTLAGLFAEQRRGCCGPSAAALRAVSEQEWDRLLTEASEQYVLPAFAASLASVGILPHIPMLVAEFLPAVHAANRERNEELSGQLREAIALLNRVGLRPVLLKGAIRLIDGLYPDIGWRSMRDLDLLVPACRIQDAATALEAVGYASSPDRPGSLASRFPHHHYPRLTHPHRLAPIELHTELFAFGRGRSLLGGAETMDAATEFELAGAAFAVPVAEHQFAHLVGHCQISSRGYACGQIMLRDLLEAMFLLGQPKGAFAMATAQARFTARGHPRAMTTFLAVLAKLGLMPHDCTAPAPDLLVRLQGYRISVQSSSRVAGAVGAWFGWQTVLAQKLATQVSGLYQSRFRSKSPAPDDGGQLQAPRPWR